MSSLTRHKTEANTSNSFGLGRMQRRSDTKPVELDATSIASVSESSHWSGGAGDDLDNVALVNGSDANPMENKDWSSYLAMSKNGYTSSDQGDEDEEDAGETRAHQANSSNEDLTDNNNNDDADNDHDQDEDDEDDHDQEDDDDLATSKKCYDSNDPSEHEDNDADDDSYNSDEDLDDDDIWTIKPKLYTYYEKQFRTMQPNLNGFIIGSVAKPFFERSKLPLNELSKIWELSDVTKDGALSFAEFCTAMHLVVLRVRNFELPNELPAKLQPYAPLIDFNSETSLAKTDSADSPSKSMRDDEFEATRPLHFGAKPHNDVGIAHPVAVRARPNVPEPPPRHSRSSSLGAVNNVSIPPPPASQPSSAQCQATMNTPRIFQQQPTVPPRITSPINNQDKLNAHQQQQQNNHHHHQHQQLLSQQSQPPPPPPPLPHNYHQSRLLSFQAVNRQNSACQTVSRPIVGDADLIHSLEEVCERIRQSGVERTAKLSAKNQQPSAHEQADQLVESIRSHTEQNQMLRRVFNELERELKGLTDQRIALEIKLDCLNSRAPMTNSVSTPAISLSTPQTTKQLVLKSAAVPLAASTSPLSINVNSSCQNVTMQSNKLNI